MDNQHRVIKGYRELDAKEIDAMNKVKSLGEECEAVLAILRNRAEYDQRWLSIATTHLQEGLMAAVRAIARPTTF